LSHPYEALSARTLRAATVGTLAAWGFLTLVLAWAVPVTDVAQVGTLMEATEPGARSAILGGLEPSVAVSLAFLLGFDFLYDVVHNNAAAFFAVWGAVRRDTRLARSVAGGTAWVLWLDSGLNVFENLAFLHVLRSPSAASLLPAISAAFSFRSATLALGILVGVAIHLSAWHEGSRPPSFPSHRQGC